MYKVECETFEKTIFDNIVCEIKSAGRGVQVLNFYFDILIKIDDDFVANLEMTSKTSTNAFKNLFLNTSANLCGDVFGSPLIQVVKPMFEKFAPGLIHKCPYFPIKEFGMHNFSIDPSTLSLLTFSIADRMDYRVHMTFIIKKKLVATLSLYTKLSPKRYRKKKPNSE